MTAQPVAPPEVERDAPLMPSLTGVPRWKRTATSNVLWIFLILVGLVVAFTVINPRFLSPYDIREAIFTDNATLIVLAVGMTFVIVTAGIDLSVGSVLVFSGVVAAKVFLAFGATTHGLGADDIGWPEIIVGLLAGLAAGSAFGLLNGVLVAKAKVPALIATLGTYGIALGASYLLTNGVDLANMPALLTNDIGNTNVFGQIPVLVIITAVVAVLGGLLLAFTRFGRYTYAIGSNEEAARRVGINVSRHLIKVYGLMGLLSGCAGCMSLALFSTTTLTGHTADNLGAIAAVVIGGTSLFGGRGLVAGSVIGALIPATLASGFVIIGVNPYWQYIAVGIVLIGAVYLDQWRRRTREHA
jgi:ribose transport system permease protein